MFRLLCLLFGLLLTAAPGALRAQDDSADGQETPLDSPFLVEPKTPADLFEAARIATRLARPRLARNYLDQLLAAADDAALLQLRDQHGPGEFIRLARIRDLQPQSTQLLQRTNEAFRRKAEDPALIAGLLDDLIGSPSEKTAALQTLRDGGPGVVSPMLAVLTDDSRANLHQPVTLALSQLGQDAIEPLIAALGATDTRIQTGAMVALGAAQSRAAVPSLWQPAFAPGQPADVRAAARGALQQILAGASDIPGRISNYGAAERLYERAWECFSGSRKWETDTDGQVALWHWDMAEEKVAMKLVPPEAASQQVGLKFARGAMELSPEKARHQHLLLALALGADSAASGWDAPLATGPGTAHDLALSVGAATINGALELALEANNIPAIRGALETIWQVGNRSLVAGASRDTAPLIAALSHPDPRVQFAAANAILNIDSSPSFVGSTRLVGVLKRGLSSTTTANCLVIDPNTGRARTIAGVISALGYDTRTASTGRAGFRIAADNGDVSLIAVNANTVQWALTDTIANLRADARTAGIPIVIYGPAYVEARIQSLLQQNADVTFIEEVDNGNDATQQFVNLKLKPFLDAARPQLTEAQLTAQKAAAAGWFAQLAGGDRHSEIDFTSAEETLYIETLDESVAPQCLVGLAAIPTGTAQGRIQRIVVDTNRSEGLRLAAVNELTFHIQRNGLMIDQEAQAELRQLARASTGTPLATPTAALAGAMQPASQRVFELLRTHAPVQLP